MEKKEFCVNVLQYRIKRILIKKALLIKRKRTFALQTLREG